MGIQKIEVVHQGLFVSYLYVYVYDNIYKDNKSKFPKTPYPHTQRGFGNGVESGRSVQNLSHRRLNESIKKSCPGFTTKAMFSTSPPTLKGMPPSRTPTLNVSKLMLSMTGEAMVVGFRLILSRRGSNHPASTSQWESRKTTTSPVAASTPATRDLINPSGRFHFRHEFQEGGWGFCLELGESEVVKLRGEHRIKFRGRGRERKLLENFVFFPFLFGFCPRRHKAPPAPQ